MKDFEKRFVHAHSPAMHDAEADEELYCMIAPGDEEARENRDDETVCANRS